MIELLKVRCAKCDKRVDHAAMESNDYGNRIRVKVWCHGDSDTMELAYTDIEDPDVLKQMMAQEGVAFATERLK